MYMKKKITTDNK